ncbi:MAG TPA: C40 family peptidase [Bacteroidales bacterium]|nr:C40 family peptidase [Bacteroidales bacterium]HPS26796.1 C40 family peptidase [Bacteroidales bacterium]
MQRKIKIEYVLNVLFAAFMVMLLPAIHSEPGKVHQNNDSIFAAAGDTIAIDSLKTTGFNEAVIDSVINFGKKFLGLRYKYHGQSPAGFDCSGYVSYIFGKYGYSFPHSSSAMSTLGQKVDLKEARKGDFIFFKGRSSKSSGVGHVALIIKADSGQVTMMHSTCMSGVIIEKYNNNPYYTSRYMGCKRHQF